MSRFFHGGLSDSETSSSDEELYSDEEEEEEEDQESGSDESSDDSDASEESGGEPGAPSANRASRFLRTETNLDDSDEDEGKRVVKSAKDKRFDEIEGCIKLIENAEKINDWVVISQGIISLSLLRLTVRRIRQAEQADYQTRPGRKHAKAIRQGRSRSRGLYE